MLGKIVASSTIIAVLALCVLVMKTGPANAGPLGILTVFVLIYVSALGVLTFLLYGISQFLTRVGRGIFSRNRPDTFTLRNAYYHASVVALAPVMLIGMQSVSEVGIYQLLLVFFFVIVAWLYVTKRTT